MQVSSAAAKAEALPKTEEPKQPEPTAQAPSQPLTQHETLMQAAGIAESDWQAVEFIISHESSWRADVYNNEGCVGLGQRCPASTLLAECPDLNDVCQLHHFSNYAVARYGGWQQAMAVWQTQEWW